MATEGAMTLRKRWRKKAPRDPRNMPITEGCIVRLLRAADYGDGRLVVGEVRRVVGVGQSALTVRDARGRSVCGVRFDHVEVVPKGTQQGPPSLLDRLRAVGYALREVMR